MCVTVYVPSIISRVIPMQCLNVQKNGRSCDQNVGEKPRNKAAWTLKRYWHACVYKPQLTAPQSTLVLMQNWAFVYSTESHASLK